MSGRVIHTNRTDVDRTKVKITVLKRLSSDETIGKDLPGTPTGPLGPCGAWKDGQEFIIEEARMPENFPCPSAWYTMYPYVRALLWGAKIPWYKEGNVVVLNCIDALRTVMFKVERL